MRKQKETRHRFYSDVGGSIHIILAAFVVILIDEVHRLHKLVYEDVRTNDDKASENVPKPEHTCAELVVDASSLELVADTGAETVDPNE